MPIDAVSYGDRNQQAQLSRARFERERRESSAPDLQASVVANTQSLIGALAPNATEAKRLNNLIASAKAAAVQLVTQPVESAPTEKVKSVAELLEGVRYRAPQVRQDAPAGEAAAEPADNVVRTTTPTAPQSLDPQSLGVPAAAEPASNPGAAPTGPTAPADPAPPIAEAQPAPQTPAPAPQAPAAAAPTPAPQQPVTAAPTPAPAPSSNQPPAAPQQTPPAAAQQTPPASSSSGSGGLLGALFGRR